MKDVRVGIKVLGGKIPADTSKIDDLAKLKWF
jgi:hypothetical protein